MYEFLYGYCNVCLSVEKVWVYETMKSLNIWKNCMYGIF